MTKAVRKLFLGYPEQGTIWTLHNSSYKVRILKVHDGMVDYILYPSATIASSMRTQAFLSIYTQDRTGDK